MTVSFKVDDEREKGKANEHEIESNCSFADYEERRERKGDEG